MATPPSHLVPTTTVVTTNEFNGTISISPRLLEQLADSKHWQIAVGPESIVVTPYEPREFPDYTPPTDAEIEAAIAAVRQDRKRRRQQQTSH